MVRGVLLFLVVFGAATTHASDEDAILKPLMGCPALLGLRIEARRAILRERARQIAVQQQTPQPAPPRPWLFRRLFGSTPPAPPARSPLRKPLKTGVVFHESYVRDIAARRESDEPRLMYADWLSENGYEEFELFLRVQLAMARISENLAPDDPQTILRKQLSDRADRLWNRNSREWYPLRLRGTLWDIEFRRGFPSELTVLAVSVPRLLGREQVPSVRLQSHDGAIYGDVERPLPKEFHHWFDYLFAQAPMLDVLHIEGEATWDRLFPLFETGIAGRFLSCLLFPQTFTAADTENMLRRAGDLREITLFPTSEHSVVAPEVLQEIGTRLGWEVLSATISRGRLVIFRKRSP